MSQMLSSFTEAEIFGRIVHPEDGNLPQEISQLILNLRFESEDVTHMTQLAEKNNQGLLSETERQEMGRYLRVGNFLNLLHAKARRSLQNSNH